MATGSGKTFTAVNAAYRLIKFGGARRVLFLVDRANLGEQAEKEFQGYRTPDDNRKFTELYNVQRLTSNTIGPRPRSSSRPSSGSTRCSRASEFDPRRRRARCSSRRRRRLQEPLPVVYNRADPARVLRLRSSSTSATAPSTTLWRQVLEYFDAFLIGLTATPAKQTSASSTRTWSWSTATSRPWPTA